MPAPRLVFAKEVADRASPLIGPQVDAAASACNNANVMKRLGLLLFSVAMLATTQTWAVAAGEAAPAFALPTGTGQSVELDKLRGNVVYVDFWASWCGPCKRSFPWMNEMTRKYGPKGLTIVAINVDKKREDAEKFLKLTPAEFTVVYDPAGNVPASWQVTAMPSSYLVDASGKVVLVESGFKDERKGEVEARIRAALGAR
jgi:cytochrome c biogenesis protein CcmG/thiol:disulfide interchange protein DsbE